MTSDTTTDRSPPSGSRRPVLFISHRHSDRPIADVLRRFIKDRSGGRVRVFQSSSSDAEKPQIGRQLHEELKQNLWSASVVVLVFTYPEQDWSYPMWECGVATQPTSPATNTVVLQFGPKPPSVYASAVRGEAQNLESIQSFTNDFLTGADFFPGYGEAVAPGFQKNGEEVQDAARELHRAFAKFVIPDDDAGEDWATVPFLRLQLSFAEMEEIRALDALAGARAALDSALVSEIDAEASQLFGVGKVQPLAPFRRLVDAWQEGRPEASTRWIDDLAEQLRGGSLSRFPRFTWQLFRSVDDADRAKYAPILSRVRSVPRHRRTYFNFYFNKFNTDDDGAVQIGFADQPQATPYAIPSVALDTDSHASGPERSQIPADTTEPPRVARWQDVSDGPAKSVLGALATAGSEQRYRSVNGMAKQTRLAPSVVQAVIDSYPEFVQRSSIPSRNGEALFRLRDPAGR